MELILKGNEKNIKRFLGSYGLWLKRNSIEIIESKEKQEDATSMTVAQVTALINNVKTIEGLEPYLSDDRKGVVKAIEAKMTELENQ